MDKHFVITVISPEEGKFITILTDVTGQKKIDAELEAIHENTPVVYMLVDYERRVIKMNKSSELFAGVDSKDVVGLRGGETLRCLHSLDDSEGCGFGPHCKECTVRKTVMDTFETGNNYYNVEVSLPFMVDGDEKYLTFLLSTSLINIDNHPNVLVSILDITERKKAQDDLNKEKEFFETVAETSPICITKVGELPLS